ncbi:type II toxin-antitoxin system RelE/ParE family toxin [Nguyenibacter vanlangensis]|uniref:Type II toxin-antitoxin system RelE/ParE family toxin n=1 Tax=Nguyenibacter vanlangensis TaxID=1216886 RepID=A0A7Y7ISW6_9PROT|nr:type II toxin-antitoxin system RelE/ParE family toxin [Nguyenibacter vanlangensis]NVN09726.1 type II toxin-antitoxin system RelE/ParE family toxin [Nguyenibacter vanlangensis]
MESDSLHAVCELQSFRRSAFDAGMTEDDIARVVNIVAANPQAGDVMKGTGGCRKLRISGRGRGKSGGYRTITFFGGDDLPVFLITVFSKGERANLTKSEQNALSVISGQIIESYQKKVVKVGIGA